MLLPALVLTRQRRCPQILMCDPFVPLKPTPLCDLEVASSGNSVHTGVGSKISTAPEATNASNSFPPRVPSFRSLTELMVVVGSSSLSRPNRSLSASLDGSAPTSSTSRQSSADGQLGRSNVRRCCTALTSSSSPSDLSTCPMSMG